MQMLHAGTQTIETPRLILRRFTTEDAQAMYDNWASDPEVTRYLTWPTHPNVDATRQLLATWVEQYEKPDVYQWAIGLRAADGMPIGPISVVALNERTHSAEVGYCIGRSWWHQGITSEALEAVLGYLFGTVGAWRVSARHDPHNPHSGGVMRKCGMRLEGTLRQADVNNQGVCDVSVYGILAQEYADAHGLT